MNARYAAGIGLLLVLLAGRAAALEMTLPTHERLELPNGTVLVLSEKHGLPLIGLEAIVRGGAVTDPEGLNGQTSLLVKLMQRGAGARGAAAFAEAVDSVGGQLVANAGIEAVRITADFMSRDAELMLELVADMLRRPAFDEAELIKLRDRSVNLIKAAKGGDPGRLLPVYGNAFLFGTHPYGNPVDGSESTLAAITNESLLKHHGDFFGGDRLIISVVGDFNMAAMKERLTALFGDWPAAAAPLPVLTAPDTRTGRRVLLIDRPGSAQTHFWIGNIGVAADYPHRAALDLVNTILGGRYTSMLNTRLRVEANLGYGARSMLFRPSLPGAVVISSSVESGRTNDAVELVLEVLADLKDAGVDEDDLLSAKNYTLGQFPLALETAPQIAAQLAMLELYGLDVSYVGEYADALASAATDEELIDAVIAEVYPSTEDLSFILIGDASSIRESVGQYGPVTEMSIEAPGFRQ